MMTTREGQITLKLSQETEKTTGRLTSIDVMRGIAIFGLMGGENLIHRFNEIRGSETSEILAEQFEHVEWEGIHIYDLGQPAFIFLVGVSATFSLRKIIDQHGKKAAYLRIFRRSLFLFLAGIIWNGGLSQPWPDVRILGVLQRIALSYLFAGLIYSKCKTRGVFLFFGGILIAYWGLLALVPVPGIGKANYEPGKNLANYVDKEILPGNKYFGEWDPEGLLSTIPSVSNCLFGVLAGILLRNPSISGNRKAAILVSGGILTVLLGHFWGRSFPIIANICTSSFVLVAGGYSCILTGMFFTVIEIWGFRTWSRPFVWIGMNPLTLYFVSELVPVQEIALHFVGGDIQNALGVYGPLVQNLVALGLLTWLAWFMYQRKVSIRA